VVVAGPDLPHAAAEVSELAGLYPDAEQLTGHAAAVDAVTAALDGAELGHIAAHGRFRDDNPQFSTLQLADGPLIVHDLLRLDRPPRHVVLSACDSGMSAGPTGDELLGFAAALLAQGTQSLVAALAQVPDESGRPLMLRFHHLLDSGLRPAAALAMAQQEQADTGVLADRIGAAGFLCFGAG
jgi:CHAT domain-containing protein